MLAAVQRPPPACRAAGQRCQVASTRRRSLGSSAARQGRATTGGGAAAAAAAASDRDGSDASRPLRTAIADLSGLTDEELLQTLQLRQLSEAGSRAQREARLAAFMKDPAAFPRAACRPTTTAELLAGRLFGGQPQLRAHIQLLLQLLRGEPELGPAHPDYPFLLALLQRHPRYTEKVAPPVAAFRVRESPDPEGGQRVITCFEFLDVRGAWDDFSYRKCLNFAPRYSEVLMFRDAMRYALKDQLHAFRLASAKRSARNQRVWTCDCCGRRANSMRIEYGDPSFGELVRGFCASTTLQPPPVDGRDPLTGRGCFTDEAWLAEWRRYHRRHARQLRLTCMRCIKARQAQREAEKAEKEAHLDSLAVAAALGGGKPPPS